MTPVSRSILRQMVSTEPVDQGELRRQQVLLVVPPREDDTVPAFPQRLAEALAEKARAPRDQDGRHQGLALIPDAAAAATAGAAASPPRVDGKPKNTRHRW